MAFGMLFSQIMAWKKIKISFSFLASLFILGSLAGGLYLVAGVYVSLFMVCFIFWLNYRFSEQSRIEAVSATSYGMIIMIISDHLASVLDRGTAAAVESSSIWMVLIHLGWSLLTGTALAWIASCIAKTFMKRRNIEEQTRRVFALIGAAALITYYLSIYLGVYWGNTFQIIQLNLIFFAVYLLMALTGFYLYAESMRRTYELKQQEAEHAALQLYTEQLENQYTEIRKFRHDYQNVLLSLGGFIEGDDLPGLQKYYREHIRRTSDKLHSNSFKLENLGRIKVKELKGIVASKLVFAQEAGIDASFEAAEKVERIDMDPLALVRIMGILLDNAIEELHELGHGTLKVAVVKDSCAVHIIVQNTCRSDIPKIHKLKQAGFSTRGEGRGLGLSNAAEILQQLPNVTSETSVENEVFTQILIISNRE